MTISGRGFRTINNVPLLFGVAVDVEEAIILFVVRLTLFADCGGGSCNCDEVCGEGSLSPNEDLANVFARSDRIEEASRSYINRVINNKVKVRETRAYQQRVAKST